MVLVSAVAEIALLAGVVAAVVAAETAAVATALAEGTLEASTVALVPAYRPVASAVVVPGNAVRNIAVLGLAYHVDCRPTNCGQKHSHSSPVGLE